ncbi:MAG TPA: zf-HC2 domain-containing protein [Candidatus Cloacimonadota bacterium]|jgi:predicted anti-sigma-YlaC factor YlaD|nr:zf-HC2 domain-containing protein [Candidatus Cloacimonadota bacterium]
MRCSTAERYLSKRIDRELPHRQAKALELHLQACPSCRQIDLHNQAVKTALKQDIQVEFPQWLHHRIIHNLPVNPHKGFAERWKLSYATAIMAVLFSLYAGTWVGIQSFSTSSDATAYTGTSESSQISFGQISLLEAYDE